MNDDGYCLLNWNVVVIFVFVLICVKQINYQGQVSYEKYCSIIFEVNVLGTKILNYKLKFYSTYKIKGIGNPMVIT